MTVGVLGATSPVGTQVLNQLVEKGMDVIAFSRTRADSQNGSLRWVNLPSLDTDALRRQVGSIDLWIAASPIWIMPEHFAMMSQFSARRIVCVSSTSQFTKASSSSPDEERVVRQLVEGERALMNWAGSQGIGWTVLRPTLIYGRSNDRNLSEIVKIIRKLRLFPLFGKAEGLRQPIYVDDVALACVLAGLSPSAVNKAYNISGAERLSYKEMVTRVFVTMGLKPRFLTINLSLFSFALFFLKKIPRYRKWNADMVLRMNRDMVFDHSDAARDFGFSPQRFALMERDVQ
ncbi:NAD-dependent epimerase/dehydratase family protein [Pollutimonas sp. H1-120]|uniref:NAD-dependent epimerase/dehydratase family protein n=1 Tax=Pollutimonas sp. H1-120 TaxID=3148824 RepID=UPI003B51A9F4